MSDETIEATTTPPPTTTTTTNGGPRTMTRRLGGMITQPLRTFRALLDNDDAHPIEPLLLYAVVVLGINAAETYRLLALASDAPLIVFRRLIDLILRTGRTDLAVVVAAALIVGGINGLSGGRFVRTAIAVTYLLVPLAVLKAVGGALSVAGVEVWALPHRAVDSLAVVIGKRVDPFRVVVKSVVAYGPGLAVLVAWLLTKKKPWPSPHLLWARIGAAAVALSVAMLGLGAGVDVINRRERIRPKLRGDAFPQLALPQLDGVGTLDVTSLVGDGKGKVLIVDFWASWCGPCKRSLPELSQIAVDYKDKGLVVVGVNREPMERAAAREAWQTIAPSFDSVVDSKGLGERIGLTSLPSSYVVDAAGQIRHIHLGYTAPEKVRAEVDALLAEASGP